MRSSCLVVISLKSYRRFDITASNEYHAMNNATVCAVLLHTCSITITKPLVFTLVFTHGLYSASHSTNKAAMLVYTQQGGLHTFRFMLMFIHAVLLLLNYNFYYKVHS